MHLTLDLVRPTARASRLGVVAGGPVTGLALLVFLSFLERPMALLLVLVGLLMVISVGYLFDDPAADVLAASPFDLARRRLTRLALGMPVVIAGWLLALRQGSFLDGYDALPVGALTVEIAAFAAFTLAVAAVAARRGDHAPGISAAAGLFVMVALLFVARQALPSAWPIPELQPNTHADRWRWVLAASLAVLAWASRDPASRRPPRR